MQSNSKRTVYVCSDAELQDDQYYRRLWLSARNIKIPRRKWLDELADCFCAYSGEVRYKSGDIYEIPSIDEAFGDDFDCRWLSYYLMPDQTGKFPISKSRMNDRMRLIDLYFKIRHPQIAEHFSR